MINTYIQTKSYEVTQLDDELIILDSDHFTITRLNKVGGVCWSLLSEAQTVESLTHAIQERYPRFNEDVKSDIQFFLSDLIHCGLIQEGSRIAI